MFFQHINNMCIGTRNNKFAKHADSLVFCCLGLFLSATISSEIHKTLKNEYKFVSMCRGDNFVARDLGFHYLW